ncbi:uncharacterized protein [Heterodontus francisci]|uniref:uncharacterized protein n=1 Tax=Heterodontus francisci TaxID=7792 RepID=UPI00355C0DD1
MAGSRRANPVNLLRSCRSIIKPGDESTRLLRYVSSKLSLLELGDTATSTPLRMGTRAESVPESEQPTEDSMAEESVTTSVEDMRKQLHISRATISVLRLQPPVEMSLSVANSVELMRRGLKLDRFTKQKKKRKTRMREIVKQPIFLDIYENKEALHRRRRRKQRRDSKGNLKFPSFIQKARKPSTDSDVESSSLQLDDETLNSIRIKEVTFTEERRRRQSSVSKWISMEVQRRMVRKAVRLKRESMNEERRILQQMQRIERQRSLPRHEHCIQPQAVLQVMEAHADETSQTEPQHAPDSRPSRLQRKTWYPKPLLLPPPLPPTLLSSGLLAVRATGIPPISSRPPVQEDPRMFVIVRETYAPPKMPVPTPLEERLLKERFPNYKLPFAKHSPRLIERKIYTPIFESTCIPEK